MNVAMKPAAYAIILEADTDIRELRYKRNAIPAAEIVS